MALQRGEHVMESIKYANETKTKPAACSLCMTQSTHRFYNNVYESLQIKIID